MCQITITVSHLCFKVHIFQSFQSTLNVCTWQQCDHRPIMCCSANSKPNELQKEVYVKTQVSISNSINIFNGLCCQKANTECVESHRGWKHALPPPCTRCCRLFDRCGVSIMKSSNAKKLLLFPSLCFLVMNFCWGPSDAAVFGCLYWSKTSERSFHFYTFVSNHNFVSFSFFSWKPRIHLQLNTFYIKLHRLNNFVFASERPEC